MQNSGPLSNQANIPTPASNDVALAVANVELRQREISTAGAECVRDLINPAPRMVKPPAMALIVQTLQFGLSQMGVDQQWRVLATGILVIVAVAVDQWIRKVKA